MPRKPKEGPRWTAARPSGEQEQELLDADEDVLGSVFNRQRPEFYNPSWCLTPLRSTPMGDQDGAQAEDLLPGGGTLRLPDPSEAAANLLAQAGFSLMAPFEEPEEGSGVLPALTIQVPESPLEEIQEADEASDHRADTGPIEREAEPQRPPAMRADAFLDAVREAERRLQQPKQEDVASTMSGEDLTGAVLPKVAAVEEVEPEDPLDEVVAQALMETMQQEKTVAEKKQKLEAKSSQDRLRAVQRGVRSYQKLQHFNRAMWAETFGYAKEELRFRDFWEAEEKRIHEAIAKWPLNPSRIPEVQRPEELQDLVMRVFGIGDADDPDQAIPGEPSAVPPGRRKARWKGALPVIGTFSKGGVEFFYIDLSRGPFCIFPERAVVMEVWRDQHLVQVTAALVSNDWKKPHAGAYGRLAPLATPGTSGCGTAPCVGDGVAFPACQQFQRSFQDFIDGCLAEEEPS